MGWAFENEGANDICSMTISKTQGQIINKKLRSEEPSKSRKIAYFAWLGIGKHGAYNVLLGWARQYTRMPQLSFLQSLKRQ